MVPPPGKPPSSLRVCCFQWYLQWFSDLLIIIFWWRNVEGKMGDIYIHIYGTPPSDSPQSILIYCLYMYIYIYTYILYLCAYMYKSQIFFQMSCGQQLCTLSKQVGNKKQYLTTILERIQRENPKNQKTLRKPTGNNIWRLFGETLLTKSKKLRENQKTKKTKLFRECLV